MGMSYTTINSSSIPQLPPPKRGGKREGIIGLAVCYDLMFILAKLKTQSLFDIKDIIKFDCLPLCIAPVRGGLREDNQIK